MEIINLTPHPINLIGWGEIQPQGLARVSSEVAPVAEINGIPITYKWLGEVTGLPPRTCGVRYIVSLMVAQALPDRDDLLVPGEVVRDDIGRVIGCQSLATLREP